MLGDFLKGNCMKKYFVVSDIHSFATPLITSLKDAGFDEKNPEHVLIVCGDVFDRGTETIEVYNFLKSIPEDRCILIRGNHEALFLQLLEKDYPESHDFSNGTVLTFCQIAGYNADTAYELRIGYHMSYGTYFDNEFIDQKCQTVWNMIKAKVKKSEITKWIKSKQWKNYYELDNYIFVHSFIPLNYVPDNSKESYYREYDIYNGITDAFEFNPNWRNAEDDDWEDASWGCPFVFFDAGLFDEEKKNNKILVCGHFRCSAFNEHYLNLSDCHEIYKGDNLIAIDTTTALTNKVNVLVIEK